MQNLTLSVCANCYKIKNIAGEFTHSFLDKKTMAEGVSHGICPRCAFELYGYIEEVNGGGDENQINAMC